MFLPRPLREFVHPTPLYYPILGIDAVLHNDRVLQPLFFKTACIKQTFFYQGHLLKGAVTETGYDN